MCRCRFFVNFICALQMIFCIPMKYCDVITGTPLQTGILIATKKTYVNPKQKSDCPIFLSSYCQTKQGRSCRKYNCTTNWSYPGWGYPYRGPHRYLHLCFQPYSTPYVYFWLKFALLLQGFLFIKWNPNINKRMFTYMSKLSFKRHK